MKKLLLRRASFPPSTSSSIGTIVGVSDYTFGWHVMQEQDVTLYSPGTEDSPVTYNIYDWYEGDNYDVYLFGKFESNALSLLMVYNNGTNVTSYSSPSTANAFADENPNFEEYDCINFYIPVDIGQNIIEIKTIDGTLVHKIIANISTESGSDSVSGNIATIVPYIVIPQITIYKEQSEFGDVVKTFGSVNISSSRYNMTINNYQLKEGDTLRMQGYVLTDRYDEDVDTNYYGEDRLYFDEAQTIDLTYAHKYGDTTDRIYFAKTNIITIKGQTCADNVGIDANVPLNNKYLIAEIDAQPLVLVEDLRIWINNVEANINIV